MKYIASVMLVILAFTFITGTQGYFDALSFKAEKTAFAYMDNSSVSLVAAKPVNIKSSDEGNHKNINVKLMTYNIHRGISRDGTLNLDSTAAVIREAAPEIVGLQEVERFSVRTGFKDQIKYLASQLGVNYVYGKSLNILAGEYGNGLLSKYPIEEYKVYDLPSGKEQRTALRAVVNIKGYRLAVYNVHLGLNQAERDEQLDYITKLLVAEKIDYVLMGDMNSGLDKLTGVTEIMKDSAEGSSKKAQATFKEKNLQERIDFIFLSEKMKARNYNVVASEASDHYPVVSEIVINR